MSICPPELEEIMRITEQGNPANPQGEAGAKMLQGMNEHHDAVTNWGLAHFSYREDDRVLDIGCGGGATLQRIAKHIGAQGHITGVDYSPVAVSQSQQFNAQDIASGKIDVVEGSVESLPFADDSFDKIVTVESFYFWPNPVENLREVRRVLRPQGTFLLIADIYEHEGLGALARENVAKFKMTNPTLEQFREMLDEAGFRDITIHTIDNDDWVCAEGHK